MTRVDITLPAPAGRPGTLHVKATSFGYGHGPAPEADIVLDVRTWFRDPHVSPQLRQMNGRDLKVIDAVLTTPGCSAYIDAVLVVVAMLVGFDQRPVRVAVGCVGGRHRSVVIADQIAARATHWQVEVQHRDIDKDVIQR